MIEKSKIKRGLIFWNNCETLIPIPNSKICIKTYVGLMQIEEIANNNFVRCSLYTKEAFASQVVFTIDYIEKHTTEITLDDTDWQEMVNLHNAVAFEKFKEHDWSTKVPDNLKERVNNFLCRDFYLKYNLVKESDNETENKS